MKTIRLLSFLILVLAGLPHVALSFYAPDLQHWINRDPMGDLASVQLQIITVLPDLENLSLLTEREKADAENNSLHVAASFAEWSDVNANLYGGIANDAINHVDPMGLDANSYADCIERYRNPITEQLPNAIAEKLGSGGGRSPRVPGWVPPAAHAANAAGNLATGGTGRVGIAGVKPHPTTWQHKWLGGKLGKFLGRAAVVLTVAEGFWDLGLLAGCGIAETID